MTIGNPGNAADPTPNAFGGGHFGAVPYTYQMGTYEVSRDMITKARNASGLLSIELADMSSYGGNGANRPATGLSWNQMALFVNWLNTSQGYAAAYKTDGGLWAAGEAWQLGGENLYRNKDAHYFLPSENEWHKAAYFNGTTYFKHATGSDTPPAGVTGGTSPGTAVYGSQLQGPADITEAGGLSPYGTMGQGGSVFELVENSTGGVNNSGTSQWGLRGGDWLNGTPFDLSSLSRASGPIDGSRIVGFRVAAVPEPLESAGVFGALVLGFALWGRRDPRVF